MNYVARQAEGTRNDDRTDSVDPLTGDTLADVFSLLEHVDDTAFSRELRARARTYERVVRGWVTVPPTTARIQTTLELVRDLRRMAASAQSTWPPPPDPSFR